jgi:uncharacterized protein
MLRALAAFLAALLLCIGNVVATPLAVPALTARVTDQTGTLDAAQSQALESKLAAFETSKGSQIAVLIVPTTGDETIEQYSIRVTDQWKLGRKGVDDGVLLLVAKDDHKMRIEVGRGLEGVIPDAIANRIIDEDVAPKFHDGDFAGGLQAGVDRLIGLVNGEALPAPSPQRSYGASRAGHVGFFALFVAFMIAHTVFGSLSTFVRGGLTGGVVGVVALFAGATIGLAALFALLAFVFGLVGVGGGRSIGSGGFGGWGGGSSGGGGFGGGGFSGGGGGFSGGGASGGW